ncbi:hypothetical protein T08_7780, partial [Trichinella sp. T8]
MLTVAAQMFIAAWLSTPYAARSYFFVTFSSTKDAYSIDEGIAGDWQPISEERRTGYDVYGGRRTLELFLEVLMDQTPEPSLRRLPSSGF